MSQPRARPSALVVIPARGGSKGIPRKNLSPIAGEPLIARTIRTALSVPDVTRVIVTTDDHEIAAVAARFNAHILIRPPELAADHVTLDPVVAHAIAREEAEGRTYDIVATLQPTSPLLRPTTLSRILQRLAHGEADTILTAVDDTHLSWEVSDGVPHPAFAERLNRQFLPPRFRETGGVIASLRQWVTPSSRLGPRVALEVVDALEGIDIDSREDWLCAEAALRRKRIAFITIGSEHRGIGHVMRTRNLLESLHGHDTLVLCAPQEHLAIDRLNASFHVVEVMPRHAMLARMVAWGAEVVVHDELRTDPEMLLAERAAGLKVVLFEDDGPGQAHANLVFNALYPAHKSRPEAGVWYGPSVYDLRDEFRHASRAAFRDPASRVLITFGGSDPAGLTFRVLDAVADTCTLAITVVAGIGLSRFDELASRVAALRSRGLDVTLLRDVPLMSDIMREADFAFSSAGRTLYELAHMGVPTAVLHQNETETEHTFATIDNGFLPLGLPHAVRTEDIRAAFLGLASSAALRRQLRDRMLALDLTAGRDRVIRMILEL
ncbi:MAG: NTP transferase domain-containing protein [Pirellulales bacterium]